MDASPRAACCRGQAKLERPIIIMKKETSRKILAAMVALLALSNGFVSAQSDDPADANQLEFPKILRQPEDRAARIGSNVTFTVAADRADSYQWLRNGVVMENQTNSMLTLENVG